MQRVRPLLRALPRRSTRSVATRALCFADSVFPKEPQSGPLWNPCHTSRACIRPALTCVRIPCQHFLAFGDGDGDEDSGLSKRHEENRLIGYSPEQLYAVVAAVDLYEDFVPWCQKSKVLWRKGEDRLDAELEIGFKFFVERYTSHVELKRPTLIKTSVSNSKLFEYLNNVWEFSPGPEAGSCNLHFLVDFQFRSPLYRKVANMFFDEVVAQLVGSFEDRCRSVYGPGTKVKESSHVA
ncbi:hypothetical protein KP509_39G057700 [Ceratopteris richardii]|uniref:Coenzyme Q-binding protein COQ10 START domain-containing protein n=1 Tax=Ceratopteris richardii TaxID=49495 RepID=A0A8T2Q1V4_CERRI|nr:hypothetical protein KP509_39G057700 [Ceratopteris richardii]